MIEILAKKFVKDYENIQSPTVRAAYGTLCSSVGIVLNLLLCAGKLAAGLISGSVAIVADALNNLSDAGSSIVTLLGFKLAGKKPDADHPFGHGRMEYLSGLAVAMLILLMGFEMFKTSFEKIRFPEAIVFSWVSVGVLLASIGVKFYMSAYNRRIGEKIRSTAMTATAVDSLSDCISTVAVLIATVVGGFTPFQIDGYAGLVVACFILFAGYNAARDTISPLLGQAPDEELVHTIHSVVLEYPHIVGIHDLVVHDYGPGRLMVTLHAEVPAHMDILAIHDEVDNAEKELRRVLNCEATIHMDPIVTADPKVASMREEVMKLIVTIDERITIHDFRIVPGASHTNVLFDAVVPMDCELSESEVKAEIARLIRTMDGNCFAVVQIDRSYV
ncbi:MAG: cation transporter [Oscillospiraceae bacterium]|nr:cation transporter [Oscillospiraceae bacterium]